MSTPIMCGESEREKVMREICLSRLIHKSLSSAKCLFLSYGVSDERVVCVEGKGIRVAYDYDGEGGRPGM